jgi:hypothetical protein
MDGGAEEKKMTQWIKKEVKQNATRRREGRAENQDVALNMIITTPRDYRCSPDSQITPTTPPTVARLSSEPSSATAREDQRMQSPFSQTTVGILTDPLTFPSGSLGLERPNFGKNMDLGCIMIYLDHVFPFLFPYYRPSLLETGRHWVLSRLCQNEASFYTAASLSSYFYAIVLQDSWKQTHADCKALVWDQLMGQIDRAFEMIQHGISDITNRGVKAALVESTELMGEIVQLLIMELTVRRNDWTIHLTPALVLFEEIFKYHGYLSGELNIDNFFKRISPSTTEHNKPAPSTVAQSSALFFIALLLHVDIVSSTALNQQPRLHSYHDKLLCDEKSISLERFVGCQNWALLSISDISSLSAWKRTSKQAGSFSVIDLVNRGAPILTALDTGIKYLQTNTTSTPPSVDHLDGYYAHIECTSGSQTSILTATLIWAHAAKLYLSIVLSSWQPLNADVRRTVATLLQLLQSIDSPARLNALAWPLCVCGCLAAREQEDLVRAMVSRMGSLGEFGASKEALRIAERVWEGREEWKGEEWDLAEGLNVMGRPSLLI